jgi:MGT family glycosyltransferase
LLELFENKESNNGLKLILFSIGTLFNHYIEVHKAIIQAFNEFDKNPNRHFKLSNLRVIMATGEKSLNLLNESIRSGEIKLPENVLLRKRVPQLEILKRADLFITHCGMNSTSETIKYAVPIVGIPFEGDQPIVAHRMCNELETGIRINPGKLDIDEIGDAIDDVLSDEKYVKNIRELSKISANYNGKVEGAKIVLDYLNIN